MSSNNSSTTTLTKEQVALYDRQIRLWGIGAQQKISAARVLVLYNPHDPRPFVFHEICKNLVLNGVASIDLIPHFILPLDKTESVPTCLLPNKLDKENDCYLIAALADLNPRCKVTVLESRCFEPNYEAIVLVGSGSPYELIVDYDQKARTYGIPFFWTSLTFDTPDVCSGFHFNDFGPSYTYTEVSQGSNNGESQTKQFQVEMFDLGKFTANISVQKINCDKIIEDKSLSERKKAEAKLSISAIAVLENSIRYNPQDCPTASPIGLARMAPTAAVIAGISTQEIIKGITGRDAPITQCVVFNSLTMTTAILK